MFDFNFLMSGCIGMLNFLLNFFNKVLVMVFRGLVLYLMMGLVMNLSMKIVIIIIKIVMVVCSVLFDSYWFYFKCFI